MKKILLGIGVILLVFILFILISGPTADTFRKTAERGKMNAIKIAILQYANENDKLPEKLEDLPIISDPSSKKEIKDFWGEEFLYIVNQDNTITLLSYGMDKKPGGTGESMDLIGVFPYKDESGNWAREDCEWEKEPEYTE